MKTRTLNDTSRTNFNRDTAGRRKQSDRETQTCAGQKREPQNQDHEQPIGVLKYNKEELSTEEGAQNITAALKSSFI